jgi:hypothetical protein
MINREDLKLGTRLCINMTDYQVNERRNGSFLFPTRAIAFCQKEYVLLLSNFRSIILNDANLNSIKSQSECSIIDNLGPYRSVDMEWFLINRVCKYGYLI